MPGIIDVAQLAGVSTATVSRALSGNGHVSAATCERVIAAANELGYVVSFNASGLATGRTKNIGVVVPVLNQWFYSSVLQGAESALLANGYDLTLYNLGGGADERQSVFEHFLLRKRVDAVIAVALELTPTETNRLLDMNKPIVGIGGPIAGVHTVSIDAVAAARLATEHLLSLEHTMIGHIGGSLDFERDFHLPTSRRIGHNAALEAVGITPDPDLFQAADFTIAGGYQAAKQLLGNPHKKPTAVFADSDEMAFGAMLAARDLGLSVPADISVVGIDDHDYSEFFGLSTVAQFPELQGQLAVEILMDHLRRSTDGANRWDAPELNTPVPFELVVRSSTARLSTTQR